MATLELRNVWKKYGKVEAVKGLSLSCADGEFLAILGPSGCGKSSTLRMIAGLEEITEGELLIGGEVVNHKSPRERNIALAFETYALYPPMTAFENIAFPLRVKGIPDREVRERVRQVAELVEIEDILDRKPAQLSGGQKQAVGLARALVRKPSVFLLDEPISHFDARQRARMRVRIKRLQKTLGITMVYVTHDQLEAMALADRVAVMNLGELQQYGTPDEIFNRPANRFVAEFIGDPPMNVLPCNLTSRDGRIWAQGNGFSIPLPTHMEVEVSGLTKTGSLLLGIRPHHIRVLTNGASAGAAGEVYISEFLGEETILTVRLGDGHLIQCVTESSAMVKEGDEVRLEFDPENIHLFDPETGRTIR